MSRRARRGSYCASGHGFEAVLPGLWLFRVRCCCGWVTRRRWKPETAEADLVEHKMRARRAR